VMSRLLYLLPMDNARTAREQRAEVTRLKGRLADIAEFEAAWTPMRTGCRNLSDR